VSPVNLIGSALFASNGYIIPVFGCGNGNGVDVNTHLHGFRPLVFPVNRRNATNKKTLIVHFQSFSHGPEQQPEKPERPLIFFGNK